MQEGIPDNREYALLCTEFSKFHWQNFLYYCSYVCLISSYQQYCEMLHISKMYITSSWQVLQLLRILPAVCFWVFLQFVTHNYCLHIKPIICAKGSNWVHFGVTVSCAGDCRDLKIVHYLCCTCGRAALKVWFSGLPWQSSWLCPCAVVLALLPTQKHLLCSGHLNLS